MVSWETYFWQAFVSHIVIKNIRCSFRLYIIRSAVFSLLHLLSETTKILAKKHQNQSSISQILFYLQDRKISESKQKSAAKMLRLPTFM